MNDIIHVAYIVVNIFSYRIINNLKWVWQGRLIFSALFLLDWSCRSSEGIVKF
jgi:hypothetical protein